MSTSAMCSDYSKAGNVFGNVTLNLKSGEGFPSPLFLIASLLK